MNIKKITLYFTLVILFMTGCSKDDEPTNFGYQEFSPPGWVIGKWQHQAILPGVYSGGFELTKNDLIQVHIDGSSVSWRDVALQFLQMSGGTAGYKMVEEIESDNEYLLRIDVYSNSTKTGSYYYHFKGTSNKDVILYNFENDDVNLTPLIRM